MDVQSGSKQKAVAELLSQLLSRDAVIFNSAINSKFAPNVTYSGHGLKFRGASNLKHFVWFFNEIFTGGPATFDPEDIEWNEETSSATIQTVRYLRPRLFPLYGFAVPVETHLRFHSEKGNAGQSTSDSKLYVSMLEEHWLTDRILEPFPFITWLFTASVTPFATLLVLALSNVLFAGNARLTSSKRQYIDTSVDALSVKAKNALPKEVATNAGSGYQRGEKLAQGWGTSLINVATKTSYPILSTLEVLSQRGAASVPLSLPYPYIYDAHSHAPSKAVKKSNEKKAPSKSTPPTKPESSAAPPPQTAKTDEKMATVDVAPSLNGQDQGKTVQISSRVNTESVDKPAPAISQSDNSLYAKLKKDEDLPGQQPSSEKLSLPSNNAHTGASSEEEEQNSSHGNNNNDNNADGSQKKKKSSSKKKKGGVSHVAPPSFKEGLHQAEEHDAHVHH